MVFHFHNLKCRILFEYLFHFQKTISFWNDSNEIWTHNHLVYKQTLNYLTTLAKWLSCIVDVGSNVVAVIPILLYDS